MAKRLTEAHPLTKKLRVLEDYMFDNKVSLEWDGHHMVFMDNVSGETAIIKDKENSEDCPDFPWMCDTKLIRERLMTKKQIKEAAMLMLEFVPRKEVDEWVKSQNQKKKH